jgi:hypothetical protein
MRFLLAVFAALLLLPLSAQASGGAKKLGEGPPQIDFNPMNVPVQGLEKLEYRLYTLHLESFEWPMIPQVCKSVPRIVDAVINDFRSKPPQVTKRNKLDMVGMDMHMTEIVQRFVDKKLVKRVWLEEGGSAGTGGVIDRLPNQCK